VGPPVWMFQRKEKSLSLTGIQTMDHPDCSPVAEGIFSLWSITDISLNGCSSHIAKYTSKHAILLHFIASHPAHYSTQWRAVLEREVLGFLTLCFCKGSSGLRSLLKQIPARMNDSIKVNMVSVAGICCCNRLLSKGNNRHANKVTVTSSRKTA